MKYALLCLFTHTQRHTAPQAPGYKQFLLSDYEVFSCFGLSLWLLFADSKELRSLNIICRNITNRKSCCRVKRNTQMKEQEWKVGFKT